MDYDNSTKEMIWRSPMLGPLFPMANIKSYATLAAWFSLHGFWFFLTWSHSKILKHTDPPDRIKFINSSIYLKNLYPVKVDSGLFKDH